jgi:hypothetical protein
MQAMLLLHALAETSKLAREAAPHMTTLLQSTLTSSAALADGIARVYGLDGVQAGELLAKFVSIQFGYAVWH